MIELPDKCAECGAPVKCEIHDLKVRVHYAPLYFSDPFFGETAGFCGAECAAKWLGRKVYASSDCPDCGNAACRRHGCQAPPLKPVKPKE